MGFKMSFIDDRYPRITFKDFISFPKENELKKISGIEIDNYYKKINRYINILSNTCFRFEIHYKQYYQLDITIFNGDIIKYFNFSTSDNFLEGTNKWLELMDFIKKS